MERQDLSATNWFASRFAAAAYVGLAFLVLLEPKWLVEMAGSPDRLHAWALAAAFVLLASLSWENSKLRVRVAELMEGLNQLLYGKDYSQQREAIEILLRALEGTDAAGRRAAHEHLIRLTGQNFAPDPSVWRAWWNASAKTWAVRKPEPPAE